MVGLLAVLVTVRIELQPVGVNVKERDSKAPEVHG